jgi:hypothetical protein
MATQPTVAAVAKPDTIRLVYGGGLHSTTLKINKPGAMLAVPHKDEDGFTVPTPIKSRGSSNAPMGTAETNKTDSVVKEAEEQLAR